MHATSVILNEARAARCGAGDGLAAALRDSRRDTLATFACIERALPDLIVPQRPELNPPLWELGHVGWFQSWWIQRNPQRALGRHADSDAPRTRPDPADADRLYDSARVPHDSRWTLPLPDAQTTRRHLEAQLDDTLTLLAQQSSGASTPDEARARDDALYCFRLALFHEDMHHEAALYMARGLGIAIDDPRWQPAPLPRTPEPLAFDAGRWWLGRPDQAGFAFDNEIPAVERDVPGCVIDAQVVNWRDFLAFVEDDGYRDKRWWDEAGQAWLERHRPEAPRYLRRKGPHWCVWQLGRWQALDLAQAACHLTAFEAAAWCRWAGRQLPTEAQWERAAVTNPDDFRWGDVWEWTASPFEPFPGFVPHPYRDYSAPWFDGRPVLRGASWLTQPRLHDPRYRNFFPPWRNDVPAGFRSCRLH